MSENYVAVNNKKSELIKLCLKDILFPSPIGDSTECQQNQTTTSADYDSERIQELQCFNWPPTESITDENFDRSQRVLQAGAILMPQIVQLLDDRSVKTKKTAKEILEMLMNAFTYEWNSGNIRADALKRKAEEALPKRSPPRVNDTEQDGAAVNAEEAFVLWAGDLLEDDKLESRISREIMMLLKSQSNKSSIDRRSPLSSRIGTNGKQTV